MKFYFILLAFLPLALGQTLDRQDTPLISTPCTGEFKMHSLDHISKAHGNVVRFYDSNGAGVAAGDLDQDGDTDLVLANLAANNTIFWNEAEFTFRKEYLSHGNSRAVNIIDVDGDGLLDITFTQSQGSVSYWHNQGSGEFTQTYLKGVDVPAYSMAWADLDQDNDLDLVTASYDALLQKTSADRQLFSSAGVIVYSNEPKGFTAKQLAPSAQALALALVDLNNDQKLDIVVGNDFEMPDYSWLNDPDGWKALQAFSTTAQHPMSFDLADIDNNGSLELFATDMKPIESPSTLAKWKPIMDVMAKKPLPQNDPQQIANVLLKLDKSTNNLAPDWGIEATGWSWSAKFADLDNDGFSDLYVVNGMIAEDIFSHLANNELREANLAFRNLSGKTFQAMPSWGLASMASGRGMTIADLNLDGKLDIVINNLETPSLIFENQLCAGPGLALDLFWPDSKNTHAIGSTVILETSAGTMRRDVQASSAYLSGQTARLHFGFPTGTTLETLSIHWPDGKLDQLRDVQENTLVKLTRLDPSLP